MSRRFTTPAGLECDLDYFLEWRPYLWRRPVLWAVGDPAWLGGRRVLEIGCRYGRMSCLFGLMGAEVLGVDVDAAAIPRAMREVERWQVGDRVTIRQISGDLAVLRPQTFDLIFTKSVLYWVRELDAMLDSIDALLADGGRVAFVENWRGADWMMALRRRLLHRRWMKEAADFPGIRASQLPLFAERFERFEHRRYWHLVIAMRGRKRSPAISGQPATDHSGPLRSTGL